MRLIDLRSDTVTRPSPGMRRAMAEAEVGDDYYGEDPTVNGLQERVAALLGKESALFLPSGTMANQVALRVLTRPGDDVVVCSESHAVWHELGGGAANSGVQFTEVGSDGLFTELEFRAAIKPKGHPVFPPTTLVEIENTHNRAGGILFPEDEAARICSVAKEAGIHTFLDGARLCNAAVASGTALGRLAAPFDLVALSLSKGLGCPVGSVLAGPEPMIQEARRHRRMLGGGMRQAGILAAAGLYALDHHVDRLWEDHEHAKRIAAMIASSEAISVDPAAVHTNIVMCRVRSRPDLGPQIADVCARRGALVNYFGGTKLRLTTHMDVDREDCERAAEIVRAVAEEICPGEPG